MQMESPSYANQNDINFNSILSKSNYTRLYILDLLKLLASYIDCPILPHRLRRCAHLFRPQHRRHRILTYAECEHRTLKPNVIDEQQ